MKKILKRFKISTEVKGMNVSIKGLIASRNRKYKEVAATVGIPQETFYKKLKKNSFSISEANRIFDTLGLKCILQPKG